MNTRFEIGRRHFIAAAGAAMGLPLPLAAQAPNKLPVVALLHPTREASAPPFQQRLRELGWEEGKTLRFENAFAEGSQDRLNALAAALVERQVDVIVTAGGNATLAASRATTTIPIVAIGPNLQAMGLANSLARPGGNVTGPSFDAGPGFGGKQLELLKLAVPAIKRIAYIRNTARTTGVLRTPARR